MLATIFIAVLFLAAFVMFAIGTFTDKGVNPPRVYNIRIWSWIPAVIGFLVLIVCSINVVSPGQVAVPVAFGHTQKSVGSGLHIYPPWVSLTKFSTRQETYTMVHDQNEGSKNGDDSISVLGADAATAQVDGTVLYHVGVTDAATLYKTIGTDFVDKIVRPTARTCIRSQFAAYPIVDASTTHRNEVSDAIRRCIGDRFKTHSLVLDDFQLRAIRLSDSLQRSVNAKVSAQQAAEKTIFDLQAAQGAARITVTNSNATAQSQQILACGGTTVTTKDAQGRTVQTVIPNDIAHCNQAQLTPAFLQYQYIQSLKGLVDSPNNSTVILPFDNKLTPLLNVGK